MLNNKHCNNIGVHSWSYYHLGFGSKRYSGKHIVSYSVCNFGYYICRCRSDEKYVGFFGKGDMIYLPILYI